MRQCKFIKPLLMREPPDPTSFKPRDLTELLYLGKRFHGLGEERMYDTLRFWTMSAADFLDEYFESEIVKAHFAGSSIIGTALGPRSPGTAYVLLHHYMGDIDDTVGAWGFARGGMGAITQGARRLAAGERRHDPQRARRCAQILVRNGRAVGRRARGRRGDSCADSSSPISMCGAPFLKRMDAQDLPDEFVEQVQQLQDPRLFRQAQYRARRPAGFSRQSRTARPASAATCMSPIRIEMMERAYDDWKEGRWSRAPYIDMLIPSQIDPTMAPDGKHYMSVFVQYCPYRAGRRRLDGREAPGLRRYRDRHHRAPQPELQRSDPACRNPHALGYRERGRPDRGQYLPGRTHHGSAAVQPADARAMRNTARRCAACTCAAPARIRAAASWARRAPMRRAPCCAISGRTDHDRARRAARYDCIVIGGGHNGLVCAAYLARAGRSVLVLEAADAGRRRRGDARIRAGIPRLGRRAPAAPDAARDLMQRA